MEETQQRYVPEWDLRKTGDSPFNLVPAPPKLAEIRRPDARTIVTSTQNLFKRLYEFTTLVGPSDNKADCGLCKEGTQEMICGQCIRIINDMLPSATHVIERFIAEKLQDEHATKLFHAVAFQVGPSITKQPKGTPIDKRKDRSGRILVEYRRLRGLTQPELAEILGCSPNHVGKLERGTKPVSNKIKTRLLNPWPISTEAGESRAPHYVGTPDTWGSQHQHLIGENPPTRLSASEATQILTIAREHKGWSQKQMAARLGVTQSMVSQMERRERSIPEDVQVKLRELFSSLAN